MFDYTAMIRVAIGRNLYVRTPVNFTRLHEIEAIMYEVSRVNVKLTEFQLRACLQGERVTLVLWFISKIHRWGYPITRVNFTSFADVFRNAWHSL